MGTLIFLVSVLGCLVMASFYVKSLRAYINGFSGAIASWCSYNREDTPLAGVLISPSGTCRARLTMLLVAVLMIAFTLFRINMFTQTTLNAGLFGQVANASELFNLLFQLFAIGMLFAALALLPLAL